jgi:hypothetical protein
LAALSRSLARFAWTSLGRCPRAARAADELSPPPPPPARPARICHLVVKTAFDQRRTSLAQLSAVLPPEAGRTHAQLGCSKTTRSCPPSHSTDRSTSRRLDAWR